MDGKIIGLQAAADIAGVHLTTIKYWCQRYSVGEKINNTWIVDEQKLKDIIQARQHLQLLRAQ